MKRFTCHAVCLLLLGSNSLSAQGVLSGRMQDDQLNEVSGIAASKVNKGIFYVHNDSGDTSRFFAITPNGTLKGTYYFEGNPQVLRGAKDCEDIAVGPGPQKETSYIYVGDIGDNAGLRSSIQVYRIPEPKITSGKSLPVKSKMIELQYPDGPHDAETLMIDPIARMLYIVSKREDSVGIYMTSLNFPEHQPVILQRAGKIFFRGRKPFKWIVAGAISTDGQQVLLKSYEHVYYWKREGREPIYQTLEREPRVLPYTSMGQEEAIGFANDDKGYYVTGEGVHAGIYYYRLPK